MWQQDLDEDTLKEVTEIFNQLHFYIESEKLCIEQCFGKFLLFQSSTPEFAKYRGIREGINGFRS
jgi:hypothetical protein